MDFGLILGLIKVGLEIFKDERKGRYLKQFLEIEKAYQDELNKPDDVQSDLAIDKLFFKAEQLAKLVILEQNPK